MKIGNSLDSAKIDATQRASNASRTPSTSATGVSAPPPTDRVELSATSQSLAATEAAAAAVRTEKVAEVRAAIQEGRFQVNPHVVADRMITAASELLETMVAGEGGRP
jgi:negative regulator of flagellin synthesis FlgM